MRYSRQRELIKQTVIAHPIHCTADEIYSIVRKEDPTISLGTVYRNLSVLSEQNMIKRLIMPEGADRYDGGMHEHYHAVCVKCGKVEDVLYNSSELYEKTAEQTGYQAVHCQLTIEGICPECRNKQ